MNLERSCTSGGFVPWWQGEPEHVAGFAFDWQPGSSLAPQTVSTFAAQVRCEAFTRLPHIQPLESADS